MVMVVMDLMVLIVVMVDQASMQYYDIDNQLMQTPHWSNDDDASMLLWARVAPLVSSASSGKAAGGYWQG